MSKKRPMVTCRKCNGKGELELSDPLNDVLIAVKASPGITPPKIFNLLQAMGQVRGVGVSAINQRLFDLSSLNLVRRERKGSAWAYFAI